jgi:putative sterol carrier protein
MSNEIAAVFKGLPRRFNPANVKAERSYYFSLGETEKWTVHITRDKCTVKKGRAEDADCFFKGPADLFLDVWNGRHKLGPTDFLTGRVKSNNPLLLKEFVAAFQKPKA